MLSLRRVKLSEIKMTKEQIKENYLKLLSRIKELDKLIERIYEDNVLGKIPDARFSKMMASYEAEQNQLVTETAKLKNP